MVRVLSALAGCVSGLALMSAGAQAQAYLQSPTFNDEFLAFSSEGDLWLALKTGDNMVGTRLTRHDEVESSPKLSPDGKWIAFDASYDGPGEIYLMPFTGGAPTRLTFEGGGVSVRGWTDNGHVLYQSTNLPGTIPRLLRTVNINTKELSDIPLADADQATLSEDGRTLFFTRYGLNMFSDNAVMYRGGRMAQLWQYTLGSEAEAVQLASDFAAPIRDPMYWNGRVYFISDKSGSDNIWSMDETGGDIRQHSNSTRWQMRDPYLHNGIIIYQSGADLIEYDLKTDTQGTLSVSIVSDGDAGRDRWLAAPLDYLNDVRLTPDGTGVTLTARGKFITGFTGARRRVEFAIPELARARSAAMGAEGEFVYAIIDDGKQGEIWRFPADGSGSGKAVTSGSDTFLWALWPSPHDETLLYSDKKGRLFQLNPETGVSKLMDTTKSSSDFAFSGFAWSADGRYLAYQAYDNRDIAQIVIVDTETGKKEAVTTGKFESYAPTFSEDGKWLYFLSDRTFDANPGSPWGDRNLGPAFDKRTKIYALQLDLEADFPFVAPNELTLAKAKAEDDIDKSEEEDEAEDEEKAETTLIRFDGLADRLFELPAPAGNYAGLKAGSTHLFVLSGRNDERELLRMEITHEKPKLETYAAGAQDFELSADRKTLLVQTGERGKAKFALVNPEKPFPSDLSDQTIRLSDWKLEVNAKAEWRQMVADAWRLHRDFAFDPNLRSVDWEAVGNHFIPLSEHLNSRSELNDLLAQMSAELGILHSQIRPGDEPVDAESAEPAFLGADFEANATGLRITRIYKAEKDRPETLGPLQQPGLDIREGDDITHIDGKPIRSLADLTDALEMKAGQQILLTYQRAGVEKKAILVPASAWNTRLLHYRDWVETNRQKVAETTDNQIGYLHLRAMGSQDIGSFARDFYEHFDKDGLIIDVRGNRGGNIDSWIIANLLRKSWAFWKGLEGGPTYTNMQQSFRGHLVVLIDEGTYSDGETFSAGVKALDIGPLIGTQTAGAGIWLSDRNRLADGGQARVAEYGQFGLDGRWLLEGLGVSPDIEVDTPPLAAYQGQDHQLDTAISYLEEKIQAEPVPDLVPQTIPPVGTPGRDVR